jgi:lipid-A-disaccharide synthase
MPSLLVCAGEPSGDTYGAELVRHLRGSEPGLEVFGLGGDRLEAQGSHLVAHVRDMAVVGIVEVVRHLRRLHGVFRQLLDEVDRRRPAAAVLIDYPDFNLRVARELRKRGIPVLYYVSPQVWAWRPGRIELIRKVVSRMLVIFPFEEKLYRDAGIPVSFVGHPLIDLVTAGAAGHLRPELGLDPARPVVSILPGSRRREVSYNLPGLAGATRLMRERRPDLQFVVAVAPSLDPALLAPAFAGLPVTLVQGRTHEALAASDVALVASGTATVETALLGVPMVVVYRLSRLTYLMGRRFVRVPHVAMANLIAGRRIVPELIQDDFTPQAVADEALSLLEDEGRAAGMRSALAEVRSRLGEPGASARAAAVVRETLSSGTA